jgi:hypothetical protein
MTLPAFFMFIPKDAGAFPTKRTGPHQRSPISPFLDKERSQCLIMLRTQSQAATSVISAGSSPWPHQVSVVGEEPDVLLAYLDEGAPGQQGRLPR